MKKNLKKLQLKKKTITTLVLHEQKAINGGLSYTCFCTRRICHAQVKD